MMDKVVCLVTVHGIGFQQAPLPEENVPGYADTLHQRLAAQLGGLLGDDPQRQRATPSENGPVYVQSSWQGNVEQGLGRLGRWRDDGSLDITGQELRSSDTAGVVHVALVYASLEGLPLQAGPGAAAVAQAAVSLGQYTTVLGALRLAVRDTWAVLHEQQPATATDPVAGELLVRRDLPSGHRHPLLDRLRRVPHQAAGSVQGLHGTVHALEDDVVAYVCRNDLRTRVRGFVREAFGRLVARPDVAGLVVNAHSQGTVVSFDVLRDFPPDQLAAVQALVTAGSPLRKYVDLFTWGNEIDSLAQLLTHGRWVNVWDPYDPVADPLDPPAAWQPGDLAARQPGALGLLWTRDADGRPRPTPAPIIDNQVDNLTHSGGGGLQAHNYWGNVPQMVAPLGELLRELLQPPK